MTIYLLNDIFSNRILLDYHQTQLSHITKMLSFKVYLNKMKANILFAQHQIIENQFIY